jgi:hypothetical protein
VSLSCQVPLSHFILFSLDAIGSIDRNILAAILSTTAEVPVGSDPFSEDETALKTEQNQNSLKHWVYCVEQLLSMDLKTLWSLHRLIARFEIMPT